MARPFQLLAAPTGTTGGMKGLIVFLILFFWTCGAAAQNRIEEGSFLVGVNLGELPWGGSFKPGIMVGYHFNDLVYVGATYQLKDTIQRNGTSFNAQGLGRDGIVSSMEKVAARFMFHARVRPHRYSPFLSIGLIGNGRDIEKTTFNDGLVVTQSRRGAIRPSLGLGYSYTFDFGLELSTEWSGWLFESPTPQISFLGRNLSLAERKHITQAATASFRRQITNKYHLFLISAGYAFQ
jgi:hypothetical protein